MKPTKHINLSRADQNKCRTAILKRLFPQGINELKIWNGLVAIFGGQQQKHLSVERLEAFIECRFKLKRRISKHFPEVADKLHIIMYGDMDLLRSITQGTWEFSEPHEIYSRHAIVLHGLTSDEFFLDWAAQSVVTMLLRHIKVTVSGW